MNQIWHTVLERFNVRSLSLQKNDIDLLTAVLLYKSLLDFTVVLRETFDDTEEIAKGFVADAEYKENTRRKQRRKTFFDEADSVVNSPEAVSLTAREQFRISSFNVVLDSWAVELPKRLEAYSKLYKLVVFPAQFKSMTYEEVKKCASNLVDTSPNDIEEAFVNEFLQFTSVLAEAEQQDSHDDTATGASSNVLRLNARH